MIRTALRLAERGLHVFPCRSRTKWPATANGFKDATVDAIVITQWWHDDPHFNIGIATGAVSKVFAVDIDGVEAEAAMRALERENGDLPPTVETITARGRHIYFQMPGVPVPCKIGKIAPNIDVKADGGYVLAPPSVHPSGRRYAWSVDSADAFAPAPHWLLDRITERKAGDGIAAIPASTWRDIAAGTVPEGVRDCTATKLIGYLLRRYIDPVVVLALMQGWNATHCTPPLPAGDIERIVASIASKELKRRKQPWLTTTSSG